MSKTLWLLAGIFLLAGLLRLYALGQNPPSIDWDEASIGYNAYALLKTGKDEFGNSWPVSIRSFNDYKPPAYVYLTIPSVAVFGLNEFAVRFPSALAGTFTVFLTYFLVKELFREKSLNVKQQTSNIAALAALLLAISPWHLQFSRVAFEANVALAFFVAGALFLLKGLADAGKGWLLLSSMAFAATMYTYHSARLVVPFFLLLFLVLYWKKARGQRTGLLLAAGLGGVLMIPMVLTLVRGSAQARFSTVSVFTNPGIFTKEEERLSRQADFREEDQKEGSMFFLFHHPWLVYSKTIAEGYFDHFNFDFLFLRSDGIGRHSPVGMGLLYLWELPFLILGALNLVKEKHRAGRLLLPWIAAAPIASAMTTQTPHAVRSLIMLPVPQVIAAYGVVTLIRSVKKRRLALSLIGLVATTSFIYYLNLYYVHTPIERSHEWQYGYKQLVEKVGEVRNEVDEVIITTAYDQPYIYFLFYEQVDPSWYQTVAEQGPQGFGKYIFRKIEYAKDSQVPGAVIVGAPHEIPESTPIFDTIHFLDGEEAFRLVKT